jgi:hypothetical protein
MQWFTAIHTISPAGNLPPLREVRQLKSCFLLQIIPEKDLISLPKFTTLFKNIKHDLCLNNRLETILKPAITIAVPFARTT